MTHNLLVLLESRVAGVDGVDNGKQQKRKARRQQDAKKRGANFVAMAVLRRFTVHCLKLIRWLRNFTNTKAARGQAVASLRAIYLTF